MCSSLICGPVPMQMERQQNFRWCSERPGGRVTQLSWQPQQGPCTGRPQSFSIAHMGACVCGQACSLDALVSSSQISLQQDLPCSTASWACLMPDCHTPLHCSLPVASCQLDISIMQHSASWACLMPDCHTPLNCSLPVASCQYDISIMQLSATQTGDALLYFNMSVCSTMEDLLKWYNTFTTRPETVGLTKESLKNLTRPIQPLGIQGLNASFGQGIVATGNKNVTNKVRSLFSLSCWLSARL